MINRFGYWDLPKGKLEIGENPNECAVREVQEEWAKQRFEYYSGIGILLIMFTSMGVKVF